MKKFVNIFQKSTQIKNRFLKMIKGNRHKLEEKPKRCKDKENNNHQELDDHNDSSNWSYC
jgi:hypothetical protein